MTKVFAARFPGTCRTCKADIHQGERIEWDSVTKSTKHVVCPPVLPQEVAATVRQMLGKDAPPAPAAESVEKIEPLLQLVEFMSAARDRGLRAPKCRFLAPNGKSEMRLSLKARGGSSADSTLNIVVTIENAFGGHSYVGLVRPDGSVEGHLRTRADVLECLRSIERSPALAAATYAALCGRCSFCGLPLTDEGSVAVGYGPICAANYDLPHEPLGVPDLAPVPRIQTESVQTETFSQRQLLEEKYGTKEDI